MNTDLALLFGTCPQALTLYEQLEAELLARVPETTVKVNKSQIGFY